MTDFESLDLDFVQMGGTGLQTSELQFGTWRFGKETENVLVKYIVDESENCSDNLFQCLATRFAKDSSPKLERSEIRCQFVF